MWLRAWWIGLQPFNVKIVYVMASTNGIIGGITGKLGNAVFYYRNGKYVAREYIAKPSNPKSLAQSVQRLKMALAGRLTKIVPDAAVEGFGGSKTDRRSAFNQNVLLNTTVADGTASIPFGSVLFSEGTLGVHNGHSVSAGTTTVQSRSLRIATAAGTEVPLTYGERYVALALNKSTSVFDYAETGLLTQPSGSETTQTSVFFRIFNRDTDYIGLVYVVPFVLSTEVMPGSGRYSWIGTDEGTIVVDELTGETLGRPGLFGQSVFVGSIELPAPAQTAQTVADVAKVKSK